MGEKHMPMFLFNGLFVLGTMVPTTNRYCSIQFCSRGKFLCKESLLKTFCNSGKHRVTSFADDNNDRDDDTSFNRSVSHRLWSMTRSNLDALRRKCCKMEQL